MCTRKKDVDGLGCGFEVYKSLHRIMSDVAMLLMTDAKLMIYKNNSDHLHKTVVRFPSYAFFERFYFIMFRSPFTPFFTISELFFLAFFLPSPAIFLAAVVPTTAFFM